MVCSRVCLSVSASVSPHNISTTDAARINKLDTKIHRNVHRNSWTSIYYWPAYT